MKRAKKFLIAWIIPIVISLSLELFSTPAKTETISPVYDFTCSIAPQADSKSNDVPDKWKQKFPFDLVYPISDNLHSDISTKCPKITLFGTTREICTVSMLSSTAKNIFLLKVGIQSLLHL